MGVFGGNYINNSQNTLSESQLNEIYNAINILENYFDDIKLINYNNEDSLNESLATGFENNVKADQIFQYAEADFKRAKINIKKAMRNKDYNEAIKYANDTKKKVDSYKKKIEDIDWNTLDSDTPYMFLRSLLVLCMALLSLVTPSPTSVALAIGSLAGVAGFKKQDFDREKYNSSKYKYNSGSVAYRQPAKKTDILMGLDKLNEALDKLIDKAKTKQKEERNK